MKLSPILMLAAVTLGTGFARDIPHQFAGRWYFDEEATAREWPKRAKTEEQKVRFSKVGDSLKAMHQETGKPVVDFFDVSGSSVIARGGVLNPRFEALGVSQKEGSSEVRARHFQVPDDDNPKEVLLKLSEADARMSIEVWDDGEMMFFYVLSRKRPNQPPQHNAGSRPSSGNSPGSETPLSLGPRG